MASDHAHGSAVRTVAVAAGAAVLAAGIVSASWSGYVPTSTDRAKAVVRLLREQLHAWTQAWTGHEQEPAGEGVPDESGASPVPRCQPLRSLQELLDWQPPHLPHFQSYNAPLPVQPPPSPGAPAARHGHGEAPGHSIMSAPSPQRVTREVPEAARPQLLVCHDMANGYHDDSFTQGSADPGFFRLWHWESVDTFVYFSHWLVTVPPPGWIAAAHRNGVKVLGTFITEWHPGRMCCEQLLSSTATAQKAADQLVRLALHHGFDGWLLNIENTLPLHLVPAMLHFVAYLRAAMHRALPHAQVMWYDAVTTEGWLEWQNSLTPLNQPFFDAADSLFVNYTWKEGTPREVAEAAGARAPDVFLGTDVWGRGTYAGGRGACATALSACHAQGISAALFAPGWVYESLGKGPAFERRQREFWRRVGAAWPARPAASRGLSTLPLHTCFCTGSGPSGMWLLGARVSAASWFNLAHQALLPVPALTDNPLGPGGDRGGGRSRARAAAGLEAGAGLGSVAEGEYDALDPDTAAAEEQQQEEEAAQRPCSRSTGADTPTASTTGTGGGGPVSYDAATVGSAVTLAAAQAPAGVCAGLSAGYATDYAFNGGGCLAIRGWLAGDAGLSSAHPSEQPSSAAAAAAATAAGPGGSAGVGAVQYVHLFDATLPVPAAQPMPTADTGTGAGAGQDATPAGGLYVTFATRAAVPNSCLALVLLVQQAGADRGAAGRQQASSLAGAAAAAAAASHPGPAHQPVVLVSTSGKSEAQGSGASGLGGSGSTASSAAVQAAAQGLPAGATASTRGSPVVQAYECHFHHVAHPFLLAQEEGEEGEQAGDQHRQPHGGGWKLWSCHASSRLLQQAAAQGGGGSSLSAASHGTGELVVAGVGVVGWLEGGDGAKGQQRATTGNVAADKGGTSSGPFAGASVGSSSSSSDGLMPYHCCLGYLSISPEPPASTLVPPLGAEHRVPAPTPQPGSAKALGVKWRRGGAGAKGQGQGRGEAGATGLSRGAHECDWELECELVWEPLFSAAGAPLHEGYHVWALLHGASGSPGEAAAGSGQGQVQQQGRQGLGQGQGTADGLPGSTSSGSSSSSPDSWDAVAVAEKGPAKADPASSGLEGTEGQSDDTSGGTLPLEGPDSPHWIKVSPRRPEAGHTQHNVPTSLPSPSQGGATSGAAAVVRTPLTSKVDQGAAVAVYLGYALAAAWGVRRLAVPQACSSVELVVQPVASADGLVQHALGHCTARVLLPVPVPPPP